MPIMLITAFCMSTNGKERDRGRLCGGESLEQRASLGHGRTDMHESFCYFFGVFLCQLVEFMTRNVNSRFRRRLWGEDSVSMDTVEHQREKITWADV